MNKIYKYSIIVVIIITTLLQIISCHHSLKQNEIVLARVGNHYLSEENIKGMVPPGTNVHDSIQMVKSYVRKWVETQLMVDQAMKNLPEDKLNFNKQLEDYRNSLIIYKYETELIKQKHDTAVSDEEIKSYYEKHLKDFELKENIVKVVYAILPNSINGEEEMKHFKSFFKLPDSLLFDSLEYNCTRLDITYSIDTNIWIRFNNLLKKIPIETYNQELYLKNHRFVNIKDERNIYLLKFVNFKIKDETSPLDFEKRYIKNIIINKRKNKLLNKLRKDIVDKGVKEKLFEIY